MDVLDRVELVERPPTQEVVTHEELVELFKTKQTPKHYIGLEISGFLHLGSLISIGFKINDFIKAGVKCTVFLADWHTMINDKLDGNWETINKVSKYYSDAFKQVCPGVEIVLGSTLYDSKKEYWSQVVSFTKHMSLARTMRTMTILGRTEDQKNIDLAKLLYPPMQAVDINSLQVDIAHSGMDQRKIHMLVREVFPKMKWQVPVAVHHKLLPSLARPTNDSSDLTKMSKSNPNSGIFMHDTDDEIRSKIKKAWCEEGNIENNPLLEIAQNIIFHEFKEINVERLEKFGGNVTFNSYEELKKSFGEKTMHPSDLKTIVTRYLLEILGPIRDKITLDQDVCNAIKKSV